MEVNASFVREMDCLNCKGKFTTTKIRSRYVRVVKHESDFKPIYQDSSVYPILYNVAVCPHCGFAFTDDFSPYFADGVKSEIKKSITSLWNSRSFGEERTIEEAIETYKLAYISANVKKEKPLTIAGLTLRIAWLYNDLKDNESETRFKKIARDLYAKAYLEGDFVGTQMSETRVLYLMAELSHQIGDREGAVRNFSRVIERQRTSIEPNLIEMAKERWQEIRDQKQQKQQEKVKAD
ncbi:DUF2225 domain-containing protein [Sporosarcina highlanderae]|uniref:DUF2225 domain-containing protein n=1 Tax=Sporosarcina highlanderae TaxID=3035916 RepID=A0ABT8JV67_9BACL|nr:DUF2225 domain-containing protein [Sporosarcina highlanderae]MDN4609066.1 DUF2225 domain-containing protein [Sporosarcina highlanderae]